MILEAILGVRDPASEAGVRFAPMGASVSEGEPPSRVLLRPFASSRTGALLLREGRGVLNFTDDVFLFAQTALTDEIPPTIGLALGGACAWWEIEVADADQKSTMDGGGAARWLIRCRVLERRSIRSFAPFNRGRNAVLEAAILATRAHLENFDRSILPAKINELHEIVSKTGGEREIAAFDLIRSKL